MYTTKELAEFLQNNQDKIETAKVTSIKLLDANSMEGQNYQANVKIVTTKEYKNKLFKVHLNDTYLTDETPDAKSYMDSLVESNLYLFD